VALSANASAQEIQQQSDKNWGLMMGGLLNLTPEFTGSDEHKLTGEPIINGYLKISEQNTLFVDNSSIGLNHQLFDNFNMGVLGNVRSEQDRSKAKHRNGFVNIDEAFEVGPYFSYQLSDQLEISLSGLFDASGTHNGWVVNLDVSHKYRIPNTAISVTTLAGLNYADKDYNNTYYGVKGPAHRLSFAMGSGFNSAIFGTFFSCEFSEKTSLIGSLSATQIIGDAQDSPIIKQDTLVSVGLGFVYTF
jgi:outer membrane scaffolding protein for murein synthesis (MipA/OmpV family)